MRALPVVLLAGCMVMFAGCVVQKGASSDDEPGWSVPGGTTHQHCQSDSSCTGGDVCARDGGCWSASKVYPAHVSWTLRGMPATRTTCEATPELEIGFYTAISGDNDLGYAPVPCVAGKFSVDKLPNTFTGVKLGRAAGDHKWAFTAIDGATGEATLDLPF
jgi:hypothetical protein